MSEPGDPDEGRAGGPHLLLVEDNPGDRRLFVETLEASGLPSRLQVAESLVEAAARIASEPVDLIVLDLDLPDSVGIGTLHAVREAASGVPVIVLTGLDDPDIGLESLTVGAQDYLVKGSFSPTELSRAIRYAIERERLSRQLTDQLRERALLAEIEAAGSGMNDVPGFLASVVEAVREALPAATVELVVDLPDGTARAAAPNVRDAAAVSPGERHEIDVELHLTALGATGTLRVALPAGRQVSAHQWSFLDRAAALVSDQVERFQTATTLSERTRLLRASYDVATLLQQDLDVAELVNRLVELLVPAFRFPDLTQIQLVVAGQEGVAGVTDRPVVTSLDAAIEVDGQAHGLLRAGYTDTREWSIPNEPQFVDSVADLIGAWLARQRAERTADRQAARLQALFESSIDALILSDSDDRILDANPAACRLFGRTRNELTGMRAAELIAQDDAGPRWRLAFETHGELRAEAIVRRPDGTRVETEFAAVADIQPGVNLTIVRDVTEQRRAERALAESEERFRTLAENAIEGILLVRLDPELRYEYVNPAIERITGYPREQFLEDPGLLRRRLHPDDRPDPYAGARWYELRFQRADDRWVWLAMHQTPIEDGTDRIVAVQGVIRDVTEDKRREQALETALHRQQEASEELRRLDGLKTGFLRAVSHELRTPLTAIHGFASTLRSYREQLDSETATVLIDRLAANADRFRSLLDDLLDLNRLTTGDLEPQRRAVDLAELANRMADLVPIGDRILLRDLHPAPASVEPEKIERIVHKLLRNVARHTPDGTTIWLRTYRHGDTAHLVVEDNGPGIPDELKQAIFEPFVQGPAASSDAQPGTGIGLSLVQEFAQLHGGHADVRDRQGGGASFHVYLPDPSPSAAFRSELDIPSR